MANHSTVTTIILRKYDNTGSILRLEQKHVTVFHTFFHEKLQHYSIRGASLLSMTSYLTNRMQNVVTTMGSSTWQKITTGVPEGSVVAPLLFVLHINDLALNINALACNLY